MCMSSTANLYFSNQSCQLPLPLPQSNPSSESPSWAAPVQHKASSPATTRIPNHVTKHGVTEACRGFSELRPNLAPTGSRHTIHIKTSSCLLRSLQPRYTDTTVTEDVYHIKSLPQQPTVEVQESQRTTATNRSCHQRSKPRLSRPSSCAERTTHTQRAKPTDIYSPSTSGISRTTLPRSPGRCSQAARQCQQQGVQAICGSMAAVSCRPSVCHCAVLDIVQET